MADLKLPRLPDRPPVKVNLTISHLAAPLGAYAETYREMYGREEPLTELIPAMLTCFLESDRAFLPGRTKS